MYRKFLVFLLSISVLFNFTGCSKKSTSSEPSVLPTEQSDTITTKDFLNKAYTSEERNKLEAHINEIEFPFRFCADTNGAFAVKYYWDIQDMDRLFEIELKGVPLLMNKILEIGHLPVENPEVREKATNEALAAYWHFALENICRIKSQNIYIAYGWLWSPIDSYYYYLRYSDQRLKEIYTNSEYSTQEKLLEYREFGYLAIPYVLKEIESGDKDLEKFFLLIGAHLSTADYCKIVEPTDSEENYPELTNYFDTLITDKNNFDYKLWLEDIEPDLDALFEYFEVFTAEYEALKGTDLDSEIVEAWKYYDIYSEHYKQEILSRYP